MDRIIKVGILKDTYGILEDDGFVLVVKTRELGTQRMTLRRSEFINLWFEDMESVSRRTRKTSGVYATYHEIGLRMQLPWPFDEAMERYKVTPTAIFQHCGEKAKNRIKWLDERKPRGGNKRLFPEW